MMTRPTLHLPMWYAAAADDAAAFDTLDDALAAVSDALQGCCAADAPEGSNRDTSLRQPTDVSAVVT